MLVLLDSDCHGRKAKKKAATMKPEKDDPSSEKLDGNRDQKPKKAERRRTNMKKILRPQKDKEGTPSAPFEAHDSSRKGPGLPKLAGEA